MPNVLVLQVEKKVKVWVVSNLELTGVDGLLSYIHINLQLRHAMMHLGRRPVAVIEIIG